MRNILFALLLTVMVGCKTHSGKETQSITTSTKWLSACPYCSKHNLSVSCMTVGSKNVGDSQLQDWTITYNCHCCHMTYTDYKQQVLHPVNSVMLPSKTK